MLKDTMNLALDLCDDMPKKLGDYAVIHALGVALIVARDMGLGAGSIIASLLFDFYLEDRIPAGNLEKFLDRQIIQIIEGLAKISHVDTHKSRRSRASRPSRSTPSSATSRTTRSFTATT